MGREPARQDVPVEERVTFSHAVAGFLDAIAPQTTERLRQRLRDEGFDRQRLQPAYEQAKCDRFSEIIAQELFPDLPVGHAWRRIGQLQLQGFLTTAIGRASFQFLALLSVERILGRLTHSWRGANNFIETRTVAVAPGTFEVSVRPAGPHPELQQGILEQGFIAARHPEVKVGLLRLDGDAVVLGVSSPKPSP